MNMDIKDLIAKLKTKMGGDSRNSGGIAAFFEKNPKMKIVIPLIFVIISVLIALLIVIKTGSAKIPKVPEESADAQNNQVYVLPQDVIDSADLEGITDKNLINSSALSHPKVTAIIHNSDGNYMAVVETDNGDYTTLQTGSVIEGTDWVVDEVTSTHVVFSCNGVKTTVTYKP